MDIAKCLTVIDALCAGEFPAPDGAPKPGAPGPGHRTVELAASHGMRAGDAGARQGTAQDFRAYREAVAERLHDRWGRQPPWGQLTVRLRLGRGEAIPEPWATLSLLTDELDVWQVTDTGRWVALGVADRDEADEIRLLAAVTRTPPP
ncbi:hypothetical protein AQI95_15375 [Streptomyces yokosukanensis]|uniref:Uncharacterized protein n=1 Tax=Streptomyces yokosukanensis TaxID=67386 RepID=A0A124HG92_9ACTN|nr:hypothetical protein [Streptomyces yokosukanensis]KUN06268.1 hypothetical protein AQI95_15375 [Streptomyces yokosukanensis]